MRITLVLEVILFFLHLSRARPETGCSKVGSNCETGTTGDEDVFSEKYFGQQEVDHNTKLGAVVLKPPSRGIGLALGYFRQNWEREQNNGNQSDEDYIQSSIGPRLKGFTEPRESYDGDDDDNYNDGGTVKSKIPAIDPYNPEEAEKNKQIEEHLFSKILEINRDLHVTGVFEGDMRFIRTRNAAGDSDIWPKSKFGSLKGRVAIPYKISTKYNRTEVEIIRSAMSLYTKHTCIRFVPRKSEISYIYITDAKGCWAYVGKTGYSAQTVSLGRPGCVAKGIAAHELMHVVGFQHEHSRSDRDKYVTVLEQNIQKDMKPNFEVHKNTKNLVIYDYNSVMHYSKNAFSKFQYLPAIQIMPKRKPEPEIGQRERMSPYDIEEIKYLYNCADGTYQRCGRDFINSRGDSFSSPRYPSNYPPESHCTWKIAVPKGLYISLTVTNLDIEDSKLCQKDAILIHDGPNAAAPQLEVLCGTKRDAITVTSTGHTLFVMFTSDPSKSISTGFKANFKTSNSKGVRPKQPTVPELAPIKSPEKFFNCDFDSGTCGMTQDMLDEIDWIRYKGATPSQGTGPSSDHTSGSGHYMYVESSLPSKLGDNAILRTPWMTRDRVTCIMFSYHMLGAYMGTLRLYAFEKRKSDRYGHEVLLWERHGNQGNQWITESVTYRPKSEVQNIQYFWEAFVFFYQSDFGLDDINIRNTQCHSSGTKPTTTPRVVLISPTTVPTTTIRRPVTTLTTTRKTTRRTTQPMPTSPLADVACNFDSGYCGWTQPKTDDFDWIRSNQGTPSHNTGPATDHTTEAGYFLFIEASSPRIQGDVARLLSPRLTTNPHCLQMWYHMYGTQMGSLLVKQITNGVEAKLIEKSGDKLDNWHYMEVDIITPSVKTSSGFNKNAKLKTESYTEIAIDAVRGTGYPGDLAIDDVIITSSACASKSITSATVPSRLRSIECDFDTKKNLCGFSNTDSDNFDWTQHSGSTQSGSTGPTADHTKGDSSGYFMYIEASSPRTKGDVAILFSPKLASGRYCARFYVHMWGSGMGEVKVYTAEYVNDKSETRQKQWEMSGTQGDSWLKGEFQFETAINIQYVQLEFEGTIGHTFTSDAALDDVSISPGWCGSATTTHRSIIKPSTTKATSTPATTTTKPTTTSVRPSTTTTTTKKPTITTTTTTARTTTKRTTTSFKPRTTSVKLTTTELPTTTKTTTATTRLSSAPPTTSKLQTTRPATSARNLITNTKATTAPPRRPTRTSTTQTSSKTRAPRITTKRTRPTRTTTTQTSAKTRITTTRRPTIKVTTKPRPTRSRNVRPSSRYIPRTTTKSKPPTVKPTTGKTRPSTSIWTRQGKTTIAQRPSAITNTRGPQANVNWQRDFSCDFESRRYCGMKQFYGDKFDWILHSGNTPSSGTGPLFDHTFGSSQAGHYLYIEGSKPRVQNDNAIIITPPLSAEPQERCLTFWYHLYGNGIGSLRVYTELSTTRILKKFPRSSAKPNKLLLFEVNGEKGSNWKMARISVKRSSPSLATTLKFHFEGVRGKAYRSDLAIDDICVTSTPCGVQSGCPSLTTKRVSPTIKPTTISPRKTAPRTTTSKAVVRTSKSPGTVAQIKSIADRTNGLAMIMPYCTFDARAKKSSNDQGKTLRVSQLPSRLESVDTFCGWEQEKQDDFDWTWNSRETPSGFTGPTGDHTTGRGQYLFIESSAPRVPNDVAILRSKKMYPTPYCVDLYYNMNGRGIGELMIRAHQEMIGRPKILSNLKIIKGQQGQAWGHLEVNYRPRGNVKNVQFRIEGVRGKDYMGDIAIDDIRITPGRCESCSRPNKKFNDRYGQEKTFVTGCVHNTMFYVKCCNLAQEKIVFERVTKCSYNAVTVERLNWMCYYM